MFDPNVQLSQSARLAGPDDSLDARRRQLEDRRAKLKAYVAKNLPMPEGQMVSGHFVAPHWAQYLGPLADKLQAGMEQSQIDEATLAQGVAEKAALRDSLTQLSGSPGEAATPFGSRDEPRQDAVQATPPPTGADRRAIIAKLMDNPAAGALGGELLKDDLISAPIRQEAIQQKNLDREDRQAESKATLEANLQLRREQLAQAAEDAKRRSEDMRYGIDQRREAAQQHNALMAQLQADRLAAKGSTEKPVKPLPNAVHKELSGLEDTAGNMASLASSFKTEYAGPTGWAADKFGPYFPGASDETANWWKQYRKQAELTERHALFGAALTPGEQASWRSADISPGMKGETIKKNLDTRKALADKLFANAVDRYEKGGHSNVRDVFNPAAVRSTGGATGDFSGPTVVRTGRRADGTRVEQLSDGTVRNAK